MSTQVKKNHSGIIFGIILIVLGSLLIAVNLHLIPAGFNKIIISWQMVFIVIGIMSVIKRHIFHGLFCLCLGIFFIVPRLAGIMPDTFSCIGADFVSVYWPVLLIVGGVMFTLHMLLAAKLYDHRRYHWRSHRNRGRCRDYRQSREDIWNDDFSQKNIFGSGRYYVVDADFQGGSLNAVFGGIELDLRKAYLPEGDTLLNIEAIFGGISLFVPDNWLLDVQVESILGGIADSRRITDAIDTSRRLIIKGSVVFGGVEIRN